MKIIEILLISTLSLLTLSTYAETNSNSNNHSDSESNAKMSPTSNGDSSSSPKMSGPDISGRYQCRGYDPFGKSNYANPVLITRHGDVFNFQWLNSKGNPFLLGTGVMHPDINNMVSVVFWDPKKADYFGTEVFAIKDDGSMAATWTVQGEIQVGTEDCVKSNKE